MTQLFIGIKPNVGPVVKVLKYDTDNPLTLANTAYDRYYFNSENQKLAIVRDQSVQGFSWSVNPPSVGGSTQNFGGSNSTATYSAAFTKIFSSADYGYIFYYARSNNIFTDISYPPMAETRILLSDGWVTSAVRDLQWIFDGTGSDPREYGTYTSYQYASAWVKPVYGTVNPDWAKRINVNLSYMGTDNWILACSGVANGRNGNKPEEYEYRSSTGEITFINAYWDLPADQSPVTTYTPSPNLEVLRANNSGFIMSRPGYSVTSSAGTRHRIIDSTVNLASVVMVGTKTGISAGQTVNIPSGINLPMSKTSIVEMMVKESGESQYIPPHILSGYAKDRRLNIRHKVDPYQLVINNNGTHTVDVTYIVFNIDTEPQTTGGNQILRTVSVGGKSEIQIKKPNSSDTAPKTSDILLDTRLPTLQIIQEDFIPLNQFTDPPENTGLLGKVAKNITFTNNGFTPYLKYSVVYLDRIMPPVMAVPYSFGGVSKPPNPSKFSSLARLTNNSVKFWLNPDSWSRMYWQSESAQVDYYGSNPLGIRYYIFGIAT